MSTSQPGSARSNDATQWVRVGILFIIGCSSAFHIGKIPATLPLLVQDLDLSLFGSSWIVSMFSVISGCSGLFIGLYAGKCNYRVAAILGLMVAGLASIFGAGADGLPQLLISRSFEGFGWILVAVSMPVLLLDVAHPRDRSVVLGIWGAFVPMGMTVSLLLSPWILAMGSWEDLWQITGIVSVLGAITLLFISRGTTILPAHQLSWSQALGEITRTAPLMMAGCFFVYSAQFLAVTAFVPTLLLEKYSLTIKLAAGLGALVVAANIVGNVAAGVFLKRQIPKHQLLIVATLAMAVLGFLIFQDFIPLWSRVAAAIGFSAVGGLIPGTLFATAPLVVRNPLHVGIINGLILQASGIGQLVGPPLLTGVVETTQSWAFAPVFTLVACASGLIFAVMLGKSRPVSQI